MKTSTVLFSTLVAASAGSVHARPFFGTDSDVSLSALIGRGLGDQTQQTGKDVHHTEEHVGKGIHNENIDKDLHNVADAKAKGHVGHAGVCAKVLVNGVMKQDCTKKQTHHAAHDGHQDDQHHGGHGGHYNRCEDSLKVLQIQIKMLQSEKNEMRHEITDYKHKVVDYEHRLHLLETEKKELHHLAVRSHLVDGDASVEYDRHHGKHGKGHHSEYDCFHHPERIDNDYGHHDHHNDRDYDDFHRFKEAEYHRLKTSEFHQAKEHDFHTVKGSDVDHEMHHDGKKVDYTVHDGEHRGAHDFKQAERHSEHDYKTTEHGLEHGGKEIKKGAKKEGKHTFNEVKHDGKGLKNEGNDIKKEAQQDLGKDGQHSKPLVEEDGVKVDKVQVNV